MKKQYLPYYISRAAISALFAFFIVGFNWKAILVAVVFFGFFLLYLHSGWFRVDAENGLLPIRRDTRGQLVQRKALIIALVVGLVTYFSLTLLANRLGLSLFPGNLAIAMGVIAYFVSQFVLFSRA